MYQVRLRDVNGRDELICLIDGTVTSNYSSGSNVNGNNNSNNGQGSSPLKKARTTPDHTQPQPTINTSGTKNSINGISSSGGDASIYTQNVINISSSIYFDSSNGSIILSSTAENRSVESTSSTLGTSKLFAFILSRIEDVVPLVPKTSHNNGNSNSNSNSKPLLVPKFRIEVMNEVNVRGLEAEEQRQKQSSTAAIVVV